MSKTLTIILWASPYGSEHAFSAVRIAEAGLQRGHRVHLHATGDGVHAFTAGQGAKGLPNIEGMVRGLMASGLSVDV
ncbi:MAG: DsrE family protein [candidate division NC10 bacterium]|jgi:sulfur relay (sulfurtransferase) complex TusBCD TusD component (DsrE family)